MRRDLELASGPSGWSCLAAIHSRSTPKLNCWNDKKRRRKKHLALSDSCFHAPRIFSAARNSQTLLISHLVRGNQFACDVTRTTHRKRRGLRAQHERDFATCSSFGGRKKGQVVEFSWIEAEPVYEKLHCRRHCLLYAELLVDFLSFHCDRRTGSPKDERAHASNRRVER